jgi:fucose permease
MDAEPSAHAPAAPVKETQPRPLLGLAFLAFILIGANDGGGGVLLPSVIAHYHINKATFGLLFPAGTLGYLSGAFASGPLLERLGRRVLLALGAVAFTIAALVYASMPPFWLVFPVTYCLIFGVAILDAGLNAFVTGLPRSAGLLNYLHAFYGAGALLGPLVASTILALAWGWNVTYIVWACAGVLVAAGIGLLFPAKSGASAPSGDSGQAQQGGSLAAALRMGIVWLSALFLCLYVGAEISVGTWSYSLLTVERGTATLVAGWMVSGYWLGLTAGRLAMGHFAERVGTARIVQGCLVGIVVGAALVWAVPATPVTALGLWLIGFSFGPLFPTTIAIIGQVVPERMHQSAIGVAASVGSMGGALLPAAAGALAQVTGLWTLLPFVICLAAAMAGCWLLLRRHMAPPTAQVALPGSAAGAPPPPRERAHSDISSG